jgi:hypothetical protein
MVGGLALVCGAGVLFVFTASRLTRGAYVAFEGLFAQQGRRDWPQGVQEGDAPRFSMSHAEALRPGTPVVLGPPLDDDPEDPHPETIDLGSRRLADRH